MFSQTLADESPFSVRESIARKNLLTLARDILALDPESFSAAFRKSPIKRVELAGMQRNAAVVPEFVETPDGIELPSRTL